MRADGWHRSNASTHSHLHGAAQGVSSQGLPDFQRLPLALTGHEASAEVAIGFESVMRDALCRVRFYAVWGHWITWKCR